jgi:hypothetical protein
VRPPGAALNADEQADLTRMMSRIEAKLAQLNATRGTR